MSYFDLVSFNFGEFNSWWHYIKCFFSSEFFLTLRNLSQLYTVFIFMNCYKSTWQIHSIVICWLSKQVDGIYWWNWFSYALYRSPRPSRTFFLREPSTACEWAKEDCWPFVSLLDKHYAIKRCILISLKSLLPYIQCQLSSAPLSPLLENKNTYLEASGIHAITMRRAVRNRTVNDVQSWNSQHFFAPNSIPSNISE